MLGARPGEHHAHRASARRATRGRLRFVGSSSVRRSSAAARVVALGAGRASRGDPRVAGGAPGPGGTSGGGTTTTGMPGRPSGTCAPAPGGAGAPPGAPEAVEVAAADPDGGTVADAALPLHPETSEATSVPAAANAPSDVRVMRPSVARRPAAAPSLLALARDGLERGALDLLAPAPASPSSSLSGGSLLRRRFVERLPFGASSSRYFRAASQSPAHARHATPAFVDTGAFAITVVRVAQRASAGRHEFTGRGSRGVSLRAVRGMFSSIDAFWVARG